MSLEWREIRGYPQYEVCEDGRVLNLTRDRLLTPAPTGKGYLTVRLYNEGSHQQFYVAVLVASAFLDEYREGMYIGYKNGDPNDCHVDNLKVLGRRAPGHHREIIPRGAMAIRVVETGVTYRNARVCSNAVGGDANAIYRVIRGDQSKHVGLSFEGVYAEEALRLMRLGLLL